MDKISLLAPEVIDQISAGEVVERPAHLVKELVENSLDAGATSVQIEFSSGGLQVKVSDNGQGIPRDELVLAFARHATSKINSSEDLWRLQSFGFRGEALASVSAVSKVRMISKTRSHESAFGIDGEFGKFSSPQEMGGGYGTTIWVEDLFGNVPARKKFLKSESAESAQIKNVIKAMALVRPDVEFKVLNKNQLEIFYARTDSHLKRVQDVLEVENIYEGSYTLGNLSAKVFMSPPHETLKSRKNMWVFAQDRWIQDKGLQAAVLEAYRGLLMHHEYPSAVVFVYSDPADIDVNVHPTKSQVKFKEASNAFRVVQRATRQVLEQAPWLETLFNKSPIKNSSNLHQSQTTENFSVAHLKNSSESKLINKNLSFQAHEFENSHWQQKKSLIESEMNEDTPTNLKISLNTSLNPTDPVRMNASSNIESSASSTMISDFPISMSDFNPSERINLKKTWAQLQVLGQAAKTYILTQSDQSLIFVDQHAAHERVVYESILKNWNDGGLEIQNLLLPLEIHLSAEKVEALLNESPQLEKLGLQIESSGPEYILVSSHPSIISEKAIKMSLEEMASEIIEKGGSFAFEKSLNHLAATMACHSVIRAGQALSYEEMVALLKAMDEFPLSSFCPHGRPVFVELPFAKLEKDFGRTL